MNASLMIYKELRKRDSFGVLEDYFNDELRSIPDAVSRLYRRRQETLDRLAAAEPVYGDNAKLLTLCDLLTDLFDGNTDPRGTPVCVATHY